MSEPPVDSGGSVVRATVAGALVSAVFGLLFGWLGGLPWEDVKVDAAAFAIVGGLFNGGRTIRTRLRGGDGT